MVVCVCHSDEAMREADATETSGELGLVFPGSIVGVSVFRTVKLEMLTESASWLSIVSVVPEYKTEWGALKSPSTSEDVSVSMW